MMEYQAEFFAGAQAANLANPLLRKLAAAVGAYALFRLSQS